MKNNPFYEVGENLRRLRQAKGLTLSGLAAKAGVAKSLLHALEAGHANPTLATLWALAQALEVSFGELVQARPVGDEGVMVQLIEQTRGQSGERLEVYRMDLSPGSVRLAEAHERGLRERVIGLRGKAAVGPLPGREVGPGEEVEFAGDEPHVYASEEGASLLVFLHYPPVPRPRGEAGSPEKASLVLREVSLGVEGLALEGRWLTPGLQEGVFVRWGANRTYLFSLPLAPLPRLEGQGLLGEALALLHAPAEDLRSYGGSPSLLLRTLAWEGLLLRGEVADPASLLFHITKSPGGSSQEGGWEDRISVDLYAQVELLHPGYAKQPLFLAYEVEAAGLRRGRFLDVGTGPGHHLLLLLELLPHLEPVAVEPSPASRQALAQLLPGVEVLPEDFTLLDLEESFPLIVCVGASHHMSTWRFLEKAYRLLRPGGLLAVADEFLRPFTTREERTRNLLLHHTAYLLPFPLELEALWALRLVALRGESRGLRALAEEAWQDLETHSDPFAAFARLELQALLAGLDYEVETKTHPRRFLELALSVGFALERHHRLFATHGSGSWGGGTHLFLLRRPR
ncbi:methyltransferase [Thermus scotoductus]|uniref:Methyltransferase n=2 Tax=Thermus scotoductus TaxID=37636 RepID=A0A430RDQ8_THESC|nr:helix-turn-helix domain-containing protein [Thermus scotoductus]RTH05507.1 methyltransferase [Thermus scotoductus]RTH96427.1 methyltransferase [Thermus scotoductus]RTI14821.1 methyltransferase [Thermus scotoductus]